MNMNNKQNIRTTDDNHKFQGYQQWIDTDGILLLRGIAKNNKAIRYTEWHRHRETKFYIA